MNQRTFIHAAGATGLGLTGGLGFGATDSAVPVLLDLLENSPRELIRASSPDRFAGVFATRIC